MKHLNFKLLNKLFKSTIKYKFMCYIKNNHHLVKKNHFPKLIPQEMNSIKYLLLLLPALGSTQMTQNFSSCFELQEMGKNETIHHQVFPYGQWGLPIDLQCDFTTDGGGWTIIQSRGPGGRKDEFYKDYKFYENGFGNSSLNQNFWLGLQTIHLLTEFHSVELMVNLSDWTGCWGWAKYKEFSVGNASDFYRLYIDGYTGNISDSLGPHNGQKFSTFDSDNDGAPSNCAKSRHGAWWYNACYYSNLNGYYYGEGVTVTNEDGVAWNNWKGPLYSLMSTQMKIRPRKPSMNPMPTMSPKP